MRPTVRLTILAALICWDTAASARVFKFEDEVLFTSIRGGFGLSRVGADAYANSSGNNTSFADEVAYNWNAELGFGFTVAQKFNIKFGAEVLQTQPQQDIYGTNAAGENLFQLTSKTFTFNPNLSIEVILASTSTYRFLGIASYGQASVDLENTYTFTDTGRSQFNNIADYTEASSGRTQSLSLAGGFEFLLVDNVTSALELGYRRLTINNLTYDRNFSGINGNEQANSPTTNNDNALRSIDLGGYFVAVSLRFYLDI